MNYNTKVSANSHDLRRLDFNLELKSLNKQGKFAGYASVFDVVDSQKDIIIRGAFAETLKGRVHNIKMLWQHQQDEPIGIFEKMVEDARGLYVEGKLLLDVARAKEAYALLKEGAISGLSIGYSPVKSSIHEKTGVRMLSQVDLWEVSLVTFPANAAAKITVVKTNFYPSPRPSPSKGGGAFPTTQMVALSQALDRAIGVLG
jgi:HK97 family phage prohead protease